METDCWINSRRVVSTGMQEQDRVIRDALSNDNDYR